MNNRETGALAERIAACFLALKGYSILARNYRFHGKEIDIVAADRGRLVFVEVKFRRSSRKGLPREAVDRRKRRQIIFAARGFLAARRGMSCRFDVIEIRTERRGQKLVVEHIVGAFEAGAW